MVLHQKRKKKHVRIVSQSSVSYLHFTGLFLREMIIQSIKLFCSIFQNNWSRSGRDRVKREQQIHEMSAYSSSVIIELCRSLDRPNLLEKTWCAHLMCFGIKNINSQRISASLWHASFILLAKCLPTTQSMGAMMPHKFFVQLGPDNQ